MNECVLELFVTRGPKDGCAIRSMVHGELEEEELRDEDVCANGGELPCIKIDNWLASSA